MVPRMSTQEQLHQLPLTLGRQIAEARRSAGLSQQDLATARGVHRNTVGRWERDLEVPSFDVVVWLSRQSGWPLALFARAATSPDDEGPDDGPGQVIDASGWFSGHPDGEAQAEDAAA